MLYLTGSDHVITTTRVVRIRCTCGEDMASRGPLSERDEQNLIRRHADQHGGLRPQKRP